MDDGAEYSGCCLRCVWWSGGDAGPPTGQCCVMASPTAWGGDGALRRFPG